MISFDQLDKETQNTVITLNGLVWKKGFTQSVINDWLGNFLDEEKEYALLMLSNFIYYNDEDIRNVCRYLYLRFRKSLILDLKKKGVKLDSWQTIFANYKKELAKTRFLALGRASESGYHVVYNFRKINHLPVDLFCQLYKLEEQISSGTEIDHVVFLDDFIGSGRQTVEFWKYLEERSSNVLSIGKIYYLALFGTEDGIRHIQAKTNLIVEVVERFDSSHKVFSRDSVFLPIASMREKCRKICYKYGKRLNRNPLGFKNSQLLVGFHHNTPNNTLPIIWASTKKWKPIFERDIKVESLSKFVEKEFGD